MPIKFKFSMTYKSIIVYKLYNKIKKLIDQKVAL